ncbi:hypothetical protein Gotur_023896 [Gossypium turneri]
MALKDLLRNYVDCSRQLINFDKLGSFFSANMSREKRKNVCQILRVHLSNNLGRYLGLLSIVSINKKLAFKEIKEKLSKRVTGWSAMMLSIRGNEVLIKAVLQVVVLYVMSCFLLPSSFCKDLEAVIARFWWQKKAGKNKMLKENPTSLTTRLIRAKYYSDSNFLAALLGSNPSLIWRSIWSSKALLESGLQWRIGSGQSVSIWNDYWLPGLYQERIVTNPVGGLTWVSNLRLPGSNSWNRALIAGIFSDDEVKKIGHLTDNLQHLGPREMIHWDPLPSNWVKINVDTGFSAAKQLATSGFVIKNEEGLINTKVWAGSFSGCRFNFTMRKGNSVAHALAKKGLMTLEDCFWVEVHRWKLKSWQMQTVDFNNHLVVPPIVVAAGLRWMSEFRASRYNLGMYIANQTKRSRYENKCKTIWLGPMTMYDMKTLMVMPPIELEDHDIKLFTSPLVAPFVKCYVYASGVMVKVNMLGGMMPGIRQGSGDSDYYAYSGLFGKVTYCRIMP